MQFSWRKSLNSTNSINQKFFFVIQNYKNLLCKFAQTFAATIENGFDTFNCARINHQESPEIETLWGIRAFNLTPVSHLNHKIWNGRTHHTGKRFFCITGVIRLSVTLFLLPSLNVGHDWK